MKSRQVGGLGHRCLRGGLGLGQVWVDVIERGRCVHDRLIYCGEETVAALSSDVIGEYCELNAWGRGLSVLVYCRALFLNC